MRSTRMFKALEGVRYAVYSSVGAILSHSCPATYCVLASTTSRNVSCHQQAIHRLLKWAPPWVLRQARTSQSRRGRHAPPSSCKWDVGLFQEVSAAFYGQHGQTWDVKCHLFGPKHRPLSLQHGPELLLTWQFGVLRHLK